MAQGAGFERMQTSAHEALADLLMRFVAELGTTSHSYAELACRTSTNLSDVLLAFEDMGVRMEDLMQYANAEEEVPFAHPVAKYPVSKRAVTLPTFADRNEEPPKHIPDYLPAFPDKHTYVATPAYAAHEMDARKQRAAADAAKRKAETALVKLHQRQSALQAANAPTEPSVAAEKMAAPVLGAEPNPFLLQPLWEDQATKAAPDGNVITSSPADVAMPQAPVLSGSLTDALGLSKTDGNGKVEWLEVEADDAPKNMGNAAPVVPFSLDWTARVRAKAVASASHLVFEDAYEAQKESSPEPTAAGRKRKLTAKGKGRAQDPSIQRALHILAMGGQSGAGPDDVEI
ncbi:g11082 [Coccomyxa elongata]